MSKFGKLFGFLKKNKKDQDSEEAFFEDVEESNEEIYFEEDDSEEEFFDDIEDESDLDEQTVIMDSETAGEELIPHLTSAAPEVPADSDLKFPEVKNNIEKKSTAGETGGIGTQEIDLSPKTEEFDPGISLDELFEDEQPEAIVTEDVNNEDNSLDELAFNVNDNSLDELNLNDEDLDDTSAETLDATNSVLSIEGLDTLSEDQLVEDESDIPDITSPNQVIPGLDSISEEYQEVEEYEDQEYDDEVEQVYAQLEEDQTSEVLEIDDSNLSFKDRLHETKTRIADRFRNLRHKDFKSSPNLDKNQKLQAVTDKLHAINWANIPKDFFAKSNRPKIHRTFQGAILISVIYGSVSTLSSLIFPDNFNKPSGEVVSFDEDKVFDRDKLGKIQSAQIFKTEQVKEKVDDKPKQINQEVCKEAQVKSRSGVKLVNTVVLQDSVKSIASVQVRSSPLLRIREGETLENKYKVDKIERLRLIVRNTQTGECESIESDLKGAKNSRPIKTYSRRSSETFKKNVAELKGIKTDGNNFEIERDFLKDKMKDVSSILTQAKGIPMRNPDGTMSFKITQVEPGGVFAYLGIENNDVITEINGEPITELNKVLNLFGKVTNLSNLNITVKRGGTEIPLSYTIK